MPSRQVGLRADTQPDNAFPDRPWITSSSRGRPLRTGLDGGGWRVRSSDHAFLTSPLAQQVLREEGIRVIDYSDLQPAS